MLNYKEFKEYELKPIKSKKKKYDNNIYSFDIETTSYLELDGVIYNNLKYEDLTNKERERAIMRSCMYIWMFSINDTVYFGRTWEEFKEFLTILNDYCKDIKIVYIHNFAFEFQYLQSVINFRDVFARASRKPLKAIAPDYNIEFRCSLFLTNVALEKLPTTYNLPVTKQVGKLDYTILRNYKTILTDDELCYCENDCLVIYYYIKLVELPKYNKIPDIPLTATGHVRKELKSKTRFDYQYKNKVRRSINTDPHIYNLLIRAFQGGYTHSNFINTGYVLPNVDSYDETSAYPYVMTTYKFPATEFKECTIRKVEDLIPKFAYLLVVKFKDVESNYYNHYISKSKCFNIIGGVYDNGRIIKAKEFEMVLTDVDFKLYLRCYKCDYEIIESYYSLYQYLPIKFIHFILDKYVKKTEYKGVVGKELEYQLEKGMFNALYGMSVTNNIKDEVVFIDNEWQEIELTNEEIEEKLNKEKKDAFLSFSYGCWVTAWARKNLIERALDLDSYVVYMDTDSIKLIQGYDVNIINKYNETVKNKIENVSKLLKIDINKYKPTDKKGREHLIGLFEYENDNVDSKYSYDKFITQGAKKYAYETNGEIHITVSGVPKKGAVRLKDLRDFQDGLVFKFQDTNKLLLFYVDNQEQHLMTDYQGNTVIIKDKTGCSLMPNSYTLGKALYYTELLSDLSSKRSIYKE